MIIRLSHMAGTTNAAAVTMPGTDRVRGIATSSSGSRPYRVRSAECARAAVASCVSGKRTGCQLTRGLRLRGEHAPRGLQFAKLTRSEETHQLDEWEIYVTDEVRDWITALDDLSHRLVVQAIDILADRGPTLGRPLVDHVEHSTVQNLKELRPGSAGRSELRILFAFDPWRSAILLVAGDKSGNWRQWYRQAIPRAEQLLEIYLKERAQEEGGSQ